MKKSFPKLVSLIALICMILCMNTAMADVTFGQHAANDAFTYNLVDGRICGARYQGISDNVVIPDQLNGYPFASIGDGAFMQYSFLKSVTILHNTKAIGAYTFYGCSSLVSVSIPKSVKFIGERAFDGCDKLTLIVVKDSYAANYAEENDIPYTFES